MRSLLPIALVLLSASGLADTPAVRTDTGLVQGVLDDNVIVYKGIPFAAPPVGNLRWKAPQPAKHWGGIRKADQFPSQCSQLGPPLPTMPEEQSSEDCLYLNLWTSVTHTKSQLPVMVFFYGGAFRHGSASTPLYASGGLPKATGVILVNINYRVGPLGFLAHPELSAESAHHSSGNYALLDAIAGLRWVKRNVSAFGGDPNRVTIFGQSAGSQLVSKLMVSPPARGLFYAAIGESNADMGPKHTNEGMAVLADAEKAGVAFATSLGAKSIAELRRIPAEKITASTFEGIPGVYGTGQSLPIVDGYVLPDDTYALYAKGEQAQVPLLLGYNADEGEYFQAPITVTDYAAAIRNKYGAFADQVLALFPTSTDDEAMHSNSQLDAESAFGWQMWSWARVNAQASHSKTFFYYFSSKYGNGHGAELPYVFQYPFGKPWNDDQWQIGRTIAAYWTNFAKSGNPNGQGLQNWPEFSPKTERVMYIGQTFEPGTMPDLPAHFLIDTYMNAKRSR
jgi:para-nitrobenzyl esterase